VCVEKNVRDDCKIDKTFFRQKLFSDIFLAEKMSEIFLQILKIKKF
jgi:hypothetical protein